MTATLIPIENVRDVALTQERIATERQAAEDAARERKAHTERVTNFRKLVVERLGIDVTDVALDVPMIDFGDGVAIGVVEDRFHNSYMPEYFLALMRPCPAECGRLVIDPATRIYSITTLAQYFENGVQPRRVPCAECADMIEAEVCASIDAAPQRAPEPTPEHAFAEALVKLLQWHGFMPQL